MDEVRISSTCQMFVHRVPNARINPLYTVQRIAGEDLCGVPQVILTESRMNPLLIWLASLAKR
jgi:hypothetical protein